MPPIPSNPIDPTFNIIKQDIKYYMKIGDDSTDLGKDIANAAISTVESILLPSFLSPFFSIFGMLGNIGGGPIIVDFTPLFKKFEEQLLDQVEQQIARDVIGPDLTARYANLESHLNKLQGSSDNEYIKRTLENIEYDLGGMFQSFSTNQLLKKYGYYFLHQLDLNAYMHVNIMNLLAAAQNDMDQRKFFLQQSKDLYNDYKGLLNQYIDKTLEFRRSKILDVTCDCDPCGAIFFDM